jgi:hypothetical protein
VALPADDRASSAAELEQQPVGERLGEDGEVRAVPCRIEVGETRVPAHRLAGVEWIGRDADQRLGVVRVVDEREAEHLTALEHRSMPRCELRVTKAPRLELRLGAAQVRRKLSE